MFRSQEVAQHDRLSVRSCREKHTVGPVSQQVASGSLDKVREGDGMSVEFYAVTVYMKMAVSARPGRDGGAGYKGYSFP